MTSTDGEILYKIEVSYVADDDRRSTFQTYEVGCDAEDARQNAAVRRGMKPAEVAIVRDLGGSPVVVIEPAGRDAKRAWLLAMYNSDGSAK